MDFAFTEEQQELRDTARAFLAERAGSEALRKAVESELGYDAALWKRIGADLGWTSIIVPEEYDGLGLGYVELIALMEVMGEALFCGPYFSSICLGVNTLMQAGDDTQKRTWLPALASGQLTATLAHTEKGDWYDAIPATVAVANGDDFVLNGTKSYVPDGCSADLLFVTAVLDTDSSLGIFAVAADVEGLEREALPTMDQTRRQGLIRLTDVRIPRSARLGSVDAQAALIRILDLASVALAAEQVGGAQRCLDLAVDYAKQRVQFGRPIGSFQAIKHKCADMMIAVESARSAAYYAGCVAAEGSDELRTVASLAQAYCSEAYFNAAAEMLQIHGGVGFTWEYDVHLFFKRAKSTETLLDPPHSHRERIARSIGL